MKIVEYPSKKDWKTLLKRPAIDHSVLEERVSAILKEVKDRGDAALIDFAQKFDGVSVSSLIVTQKEFDEAANLISTELKKAIEVAASNITKFHSAQKEEEKKIETMPGVECWRKSVAITKVGLYIPGGSAPLFSTILMLGIPANIAGCKEIVLCTPPDKAGKINPAILYTASFLGIKKVIKAGGAQAIAAMAYGTESVPQVYKIFGPGNQYVTLAKQLITSDGVAIDMPAGPSEVAVLADESCNPAFVAADLLSQAEHGPDSQVLLVTTDKRVVEQVNKELSNQLKQLPREQVAEKALSNSTAIVVKDNAEAIELLNEYSPEHLIIQTKNAEEFIGLVQNAGSVFLGHYTPEAAGDYASGTNHTLPTNSYARAYSGVSLDSFVKKITFQKITKEGLKTIGATIECMAEAEQLLAHKNAVSIRIK